MLRSSGEGSVLIEAAIEMCATPAGVYGSEHIVWVGRRSSRVGPVTTWSPANPPASIVNTFECMHN